MTKAINPRYGFSPTEPGVVVEQETTPESIIRGKRDNPTASFTAGQPAGLRFLKNPDRKRARRMIDFCGQSSKFLQLLFEGGQIICIPRFRVIQVEVWKFNSQLKDESDGT